MTGNFTDPGDITALFVGAGTVQDKFEETMRRCLARNGELLRYVGTASSARDVASIFDAIDGPGSKINFIGASYGSLMGIWLVNSRFPFWRGLSSDDRALTFRTSVSGRT